MKSLLWLAGSVVIFSACNSSTGKTNESARADQERSAQASLDSLRMEVAKKNIVDSMSRVSEAKSASAAAAPKVVEVHHHDRYMQSSAPAAQPAAASAAAEPAKKKGWSPTAKGAVIGAVSGAAIGAAVDGNRLEGGVVGGAVGAATGAGVGHVIKRNQEKKGTR